jgi:hypothetical protein
MRKDIVTDFLYDKSLGIGGFPESTVYVGTEFECCCHEDWGFVVVEFKYNADIDAYKRVVTGGGRTLEKAIENAKKHYAKATQ